MTYSHELKIFYRNNKPAPYMVLTDAEKKFIEAEIEKFNEEYNKLTNYVF